MEVFDAGRTMLAVRTYQDKPVPSDLLRRIVEAGRLTGSAMNAQPWRFIVIENRESIRQIGGLTRSGPYVAEAPLVIVVAIEKTRFAASDGSRAIQSMMLTAWAEGVGSNWVGFIGMLDEVKPHLNIPKELDVVAVVPFGYPSQPVGKGKKQRKALSEIAYGGRFGQPFE
jgi:nitroreductase